MVLFRHFDDGVEFAVFVGFHIGVEAVVGPPAVDHQAIAIPTFGQAKFGGEVAIALTLHRRGMGHPVVEVAGQLHLARLGRMTSEDHHVAFLAYAVDRFDLATDFLVRWRWFLC